jgi:hypothetical protein
VLHVQVRMCPTDDNLHDNLHEQPNADGIGPMALMLGHEWQHIYMSNQSVHWGALYMPDCVCFAGYAGPVVPYALCTWQASS